MHTTTKRTGQERQSSSAQKLAGMFESHAISCWIESRYLHKILPANRLPIPPLPVNCIGQLSHKITKEKQYYTTRGLKKSLWTLIISFLSTFCKISFMSSGFSCKSLPAVIIFFYLYNNQQIKNFFVIDKKRQLKYGLNGNSYWQNLFF